MYKNQKCPSLFFLCTCFVLPLLSPLPLLHPENFLWLKPLIMLHIIHSMFSNLHQSYLGQPGVLTAYMGRSGAWPEVLESYIYKTLSSGSLHDCP